MLSNALLAGPLRRAGCRRAALTSVAELSFCEAMDTARTAAIVAAFPADGATTKSVRAPTKTDDKILREKIMMSSITPRSAYRKDVQRIRMTGSSGRPWAGIVVDAIAKSAASPAIAAVSSPRAELGGAADGLGFGSDANRLSRAGIPSRERMREQRRGSRQSQKQNVWCQHHPILNDPATGSPSP